MPDCEAYGSHYIYERNLIPTLFPMKKSLLFLFAAFFAVSSSAQLVDVEVEVFAEHTGMVGDVDLTGYTTYRLFAVLENENDFVSAVYAVPGEPLEVNTTTDFYQDPLGATVGNNILGALLGTFPAVEFDSYVTIGRTADTDPGNDITAVQSAQDPWIDQFNAGGNVVIDDGAWFTLFGPDAVNAVAGPDLRVLIGQFTTTGDISGFVNVQVFVDGVQANSDFGVGFPFSSVEGAVFGCTNEDADNYDPAATVDDGSCIFPCTLAIDDINLTPTTCPDTNNGSAQIVASGGQGAVTYTLDGGNPLANSNFNNLAPGEHTIVISDSQGCEVEQTFDVPSPDPIEITLTLASAITCNGAANGVVSIEGTGGTGEILYDTSAMLDDPQAIAELTDLGPGQYTVYAIDENNCTGQSGSINLTQPSAVVVNITGQANATCSNTADGTVVVNAGGGTAPLEFSIDGGEIYQASNVFNVVPGTYTVLAQDANGCIDETNNNAVIDGADPIELPLDVVAPLCNGDENGTISGTAAGGNGGFTYVVNDGMEMDMLDLADLTADTYTIVVTDSEGCTDTFEAVLTEPTALTLDGEATDVLCAGDDNGVIVVNGAGGTGDLAYSINGVDFQSGDTFDNLEADDYTVTVEDENGCSTTADFTLEEPDPIVVDGTVEEESSAGAADGSIDLDVSGGNGEYDFDWSGPGGFSADSEDVDGLEAGSYSVVVTDENGCSETFETDVIVGVGELEGGVTFFVAPNPSNGMFFLNINGLNGQKVAYNVLDGSGRIIRAQEVNGVNTELRHEIDLTGVANGMYFLNLQVGNSQTTARIMKQQ